MLSKSSNGGKLFDIANERGSSIWLSVLPLKSHGYHRHKGALRDGLCLRYGWNPPHLPDTCVCGLPFSVDRAFNCPRDGFPSIRHNELRDITASLMKEVCHNVTIEPILQLERHSTHALLSWTTMPDLM